MKSNADDCNYRIQRYIKGYLRETHLPKVAYFTNNAPNRSERKYLLEDINYICFCAANEAERAWYIFLKYRHGYKKVNFDVVVGNPRVIVTSRQFGYVHLSCNDNISLKKLLEYMAQNKTAINEHYPVITRLVTDSRSAVSLKLPGNVELEDILADGDVLLRIS